MSDKSIAKIERYLESEPQEDDKSSREAAAARIWAIGDVESQEAATKIWEELGTDPVTIKQYKEAMERLKNSE